VECQDVLVNNKLMGIRKEAVVDSIDVGYTKDTSLEGVKKSTRNINQNNVFFRHFSRELPATKQEYNDPYSPYLYHK